MLFRSGRDREVGCGERDCGLEEKWMCFVAFVVPQAQAGGDQEEKKQTGHAPSSVLPYAANRLKWDCFCIGLRPCFQRVAELQLNIVDRLPAVFGILGQTSFHNAVKRWRRGTDDGDRLGIFLEDSRGDRPSGLQIGRASCRERVCLGV